MAASDSPSPRPSPGGRGSNDLPSSSGRGRDVPPSPSGRGVGGEGDAQLRKHKPPLPPRLLTFARELRRDQTSAEDLLWKLLRNRQLFGIKFRRQHPVQPYVLDFYCEAAKLAVELDGGQHNADSGRRYDERRTRFLAAQGIRVIRFWNTDVLQETEGVLDGIWRVLYDGGRRCRRLMVWAMWLVGDVRFPRRMPSFAPLPGRGGTMLGCSPGERGNDAAVPGDRGDCSLSLRERAGVRVIPPTATNPERPDAHSQNAAQHRRPDPQLAVRGAGPLLGVPTSRHGIRGDVGAAAGGVCGSDAECAGV